LDLASCVIEPQVPLVECPHVIINTIHLVSICQQHRHLGRANDCDVAKLSCISRAYDLLDILIEPDNFNAGRVLQFVTSHIIPFILFVHVSLIAAVIVIGVVVVIVIVFDSFNFDLVAVAVVLFLLKSAFLHFN
jgi:hypothetical protein